MRKLKAKVQGWIYRLALYLRPQLGRYVLNRSWPWGKPTLDYLELHLADHCNLNCAGCLHYSPLADKRFADLSTVRRDFARLSEIFGNIRHLRLMGGEPLLHPEVVSFARVVRAAFPRSKITVVTNGLLLKTFDGLKDLAALGVGIDWTKYPPIAKSEEEIRRRCQSAGVKLRVTENTAFMARLVPAGTAGVRNSFTWCRQRMYCPILDTGRIYPCAPARFAPYYNRAAGTKIYEEQGIDIHTASAKEIMLYLMHPTFACRFCATGARQLDWKAGNDPKDWCR